MSNWRFVAAFALAYVALFGVSVPKFDAPQKPTVNVDEPSKDLRDAVAQIASPLSSLPMGDRMLWAATWNKIALVAAGDAYGKQVAFTDTRSLQKFTALAVDIAWRRIGGQEPNNRLLREAVESAYATVVGSDVVPVTDEVRQRFVLFARAVAWAGMNGG